ncbi:hypothetical protein CCUS01_11647 [Colletotrichum cuscutae]|uniref:Uncharacterized protein n=1 Tax=Colletotrichum cuscutae TaxID=1209917 RepID=A0AAI9TYQ4_9PEZI|nr:hypothetical protein CCUS01_11647 [Colletotrichum cuscutae]
MLDAQLGKNADEPARLAIAKRRRRRRRWTKKKPAEPGRKPGVLRVPRPKAPTRKRCITTALAGEPGSPGTKACTPRDTGTDATRSPSRRGPTPERHRGSRSTSTPARLRTMADNRRTPCPRPKMRHVVSGASAVAGPGTRTALPTRPMIAAAEPGAKSVSGGRTAVAGATSGVGRPCFPMRRLRRGVAGGES